MNQSVFVTGAANGTGFAIASRFAKEGWNVFIGSRDENRAKEAASKIADTYHVISKGYGMNVFDEKDVFRIFHDIRSNGFRPDTLVCNAANLGIGQETLSVNMDDFMTVLNTNIGWNFMMAREAARGMKDSGGGAIVFITSNTAYRAIPNRVAYSASKSGILGMARALAVDLGKYNIRVNSVLPGMIKTDRWKENRNDIQSAASNFTPLHDIAEFEDIANAAWFFGSDESRNCTGAELTVDGGNMVQLYPVWGI